jgi:hypothetical protein
MMQSKRQSFDRFFVNCIFRQMAFRHTPASSLRRLYMKALESDEHLQRRLLQVHEIISIRVALVMSAALKKFCLRKWQRIWLLCSTSTKCTEYRAIRDSFNMWSKAILVRIATTTIADKNYESPSEAFDCEASGSTLKYDAWSSIRESIGSSLDFERIVGSIQVFHGCFCRWKRFCRKNILRKTKMTGVTSSMQRMLHFFTYRGCHFKGRELPIQAYTNPEVGARIGDDRLQAEGHIRAAFFIMWAESSPARQVSALKHIKSPTHSSKLVNNHPELLNVMNHASPIIMAGTPPAFPIRPFQSFDSAKLNGKSLCHMSEVENCLDADSYAAAVLMDHHQSLCDQSVGPAYQSRYVKGKSVYIQDVQNLESTLLNTIGDYSGDSDTYLDTSRNPLSEAMLTTTLRPQSPSTKAHIRKNIILPSWGDHGPATLQKGRHSSTNEQVMQKMQAFKMVRSPPLVPMQDALKNRKPLAAVHKDAKAGGEVAHIGWGCFTGVATEFPVASSRQHGSFLSSAIEMRMRMSQELQSKELTDKKVAVEQLRNSVSYNTARQPWNRR